MGFCIYCNKNVYNSPSCPQCYRTIPITINKTNELTASRVNTMFPNQKRLNQTATDKWQDTYGKKAIFNNGLGSTSTPLRPRQQRKIPQFTSPNVQSQNSKDNSSNMKSCVTCQRKQTSWTDLNNFSIHNSVYYCKPCLAQKLACPGCSKPVNRTDTQTFFNEQIWHASCFQCNHCQSSLKPMLAAVDTEGKPCCRTCQLKDATKVSRTPSPGSSSISTPILSSLAGSRSTLTSSTYIKGENPYFQYQKSRRTSMFNPNNTLPEDQQDGSCEPASSLASVSSSLNCVDIEKPIPKTLADRVPKDTAISNSRKEFDHKAERTLSSPGQKPSPSTSIEPKKTESTARPGRRRKVVKKPCKECGEHVSKKDYRGLRIPNGEVLCYHTYCLFCAKCDQSFHGLEFRTDGKNFYHTQCPDLNRPSPPTISTSRKSSPLSEEEEPYPQTPPPYSTHFDVISSSPIQIGSLPFSGDPYKKQNVIVPDSTTVICNTCTKPVTDTCLELEKHFYHKECLLCAGCNKTVPTDRKLSKHQDKLYCDHCTPESKKKTTTTGLTIDTSNKELPKRNSTITTPSDIFKSRKKVLPRLGGVRTCDGCHESMPYYDADPGPNASRWHKKCLRCTGCKKRMDSDATMTLNEETGLYLVHCRECLDETPKPRFVR